MNREEANPSFASMGKLVNPFASHAKDPRFEPEWKQIAFFGAGVFFYRAAAADL
jgi:hypothetical protein